MRNPFALIIGIVIGVAIHMTAQAPAPIQSQQMVNDAPAPSPNKGVVGMNHVALNVPRLQEATDYYTKTMGFPEVFRMVQNGAPTMVYVQISKGTFLELIQADAQRPAGFAHFGVQVQNATDAIEMLKQRGVNVLPLANPTGTIRNITDLNGTRIEVVQTTPQSPLYAATARWKDQ